ncbi:Ser/Thr protein kinase RdoA (MazF antagonist) [Actinoplanes tereljensis]|uniref:Aminoglycoside phosphotransferase domain-containing protein n=1 Tax=Paractinoplanes tereljensis TaxID=571912 RepID=A0A919TX86_9ACTN|nr:phosphotransferase [Actinoplanes tereljensis]GIF23990.1 hypothetical protein Ate02nite_67200 [Actinoplanes tereljensis]
MSETTLPGGRTTGAVLIDGIVHKPAAPSSPTVHALLRHLEEAGFEAAPRALGFDEQGRQMLTYLPGEMIGDRFPWPGWATSDAMLVQVGRWLRRLHDLTAGFTPPAGEQWFIGGTMAPGLVVGHQDAAPYNAVVDGDRLVGFYDWDTAGPSTRESDLAFSALPWVPLAAPDGFTDPAERSRRLHLFLDAYGYEGDRHVFAQAVPQRARRQATFIRQMPDGPLLPIAALLEKAANDVEGLPDDFWSPTVV